MSLARRAAPAGMWGRFTTGKSKADDKIFAVYRREYKRRFAWIKAGKISAEELYAWGEKARAKKVECDDGIISLEEDQEWLKNS